MVPLFKKIFKVIMVSVISVLLLFAVIFILIRIPAIQGKLTRYAISFISSKTHTRVELKTICISFPKSIDIKGLYLEDLKKDTLVNAGEVKINISFNNLFHHKIYIKSFTLNDGNLNLNRTITDSLFNYNFLLAAFKDTSNLTEIKPKKTSKWTFGIDNLRLNNIRLRYDDKYGEIDAALEIKHLQLKIDKIDLVKFIFTIDALNIENLNAIVLLNKLKKSLSPSINRLKLKNATISLKNGLIVSVKQINLDDNSIAYLGLSKPETNQAFDAGHLVYKHITLAATDVYYSLEKAEASIKEFSATDQNGFSITKFETEFSMDPHSITAKQLKAETTYSSVNADINIQYSSLKKFADVLPSAVLEVNVKSIRVRNSDITYFYPKLIEQSFFKDGMSYTQISGKINGTINNLKGNNLIVKTGSATYLKTDFQITGLPDIQTAQFNFPNLIIESGRIDIEKIAGPTLPKTIGLPDSISLQISFAGQIKAFESTVYLNSSFGAAHLVARIDQNENFSSKLNITSFNLGSLLKNKEMFGPVSLMAETSGHGLNKNSIRAKIKTEVSQIYFNKYTYHNLNLDGMISGQQFEGKISLNDENAVFDFEGQANLNPDKEQFAFRLNVPGIDLNKLNFCKNDIRIGLIAVADIKGKTVQELNGNVGITNIIIAHEGKKYVLDSLLLTSINEPGKSEFNLISSLINIKYAGTMSPTNLPATLKQFINHYFQLSDAGPTKNNIGSSAFNFEIQLHNHPIISEVLLPQLKEFDPGLIKGSFDEAKNDLKINTTINKIIYGSTEIKDFALEINSNSKELDYKISCINLLNTKISLDNILFEGNLSDQILTANLSSIDEKQNKKLLIRSQVIKNQDYFKLMLDPADFYLMNDRWDVAADNYIEFGQQGFLIHNLFLHKKESRIQVASVHDRFNDDLNIVLKNFKLDDISRIIEKDTSLVKGSVDGNVLLKKVNNSYGIIADATISGLVVRDVPIGDLSVKAGNITAGKFDITANLSGTDNQVTVIGYYVPGGGDNSIDIRATIQSLALKTIEAFSMGRVTEASGTLSGNIAIQGKTIAPEITGELVFNNAFIKPAALNSRLELKHETIQLKSDGLYFTSFSIKDVDQHTAVIDGSVQMHQFKNFIFNLKVNTQDFLLFNTTAKDNKVFNGRMIIDSKIDIKGPMALPVIDAKIKIKKGSNFTFAVPEDKLTTDKGEDVVQFIETSILNPILSRDVKKEIKKSVFSGFDVSSIVEIDKQATLRLLMDPASTDSLVVKGEAGLSFGIDRSGKMSLTGIYNLNEGSYLVSLESVFKRKFDIVSGSTIIWNGGLLDAEISINATYSVRASPYDLVANQMIGLSNTDQGEYKQRYPFLIYLKLKGAILHPEISFEIQLPPAEKGILGGVVNQRLIMLNEDESALNKQVFALLVLGRFVQENPLETETSGTSSLLRSTVGKFLSAQLNQLSSNVVPGMELNFDIQSYNDYQSGEAKGRTQVGIGLKKQLFNERLTLQVGGMVDVEGEKVKQNSASDITGDMTLEYKLTKDGRYRLKAFRHNQYEGIIEGQLVETGAGVLYLHDFNKWKEVFSRQKK